jgi:amino acid adenylation domain-containing protein
VPVLGDGANCRTLLPDDTLHGWFSRQAARTPDAIAVTTGKGSMSYGELDRRAGLVAARLVASGVRPGDLVPVFVSRREAVTAILGVLMAGAAYVPLDPRHPESRLTGLVGRIGATVVVTDDELAVRARNWPVATLVPVEPPADEAPAAPSPEVEVTADDLAYVMFTSGSTGTPKGVQITHRNVTRLMAVTAGLYGLGGEDVWTMTHSYAFDFSVWEMWGALLFGGRLVVVDDARAPDDLLELIDREGVTVLSQTPSALATLISADEDGSARLERLRLIVLGGERLDPAVLRGWFARRGDERPRVVNMYGITETTVHVTHRPITAADAEKASEAGSPIGMPLPDLEVSLRDENGEPTPVGEVGEIWVSGAGLARGYLADDQATARAFRTVTWAPGVERRAYLSGDLARAGADGQLYYVGRRDEQVKVRGHRVELGEVGAAIKAHPGVVDACVATDTGESVGARLLAWVTVRSADLGADGLRAYLTERLPGHMVPGEVHVVEEMPLTPNGKIDRRALLDRARGPRDEGAVQQGDEDASDPLHVAVAGIWAQELGVTTVGPADDFFDLGGHSLLVMRVITRTRKELGANIRVRALFEAPRLADFVERVRAGTEDQAPAALDS